MPSVEALWLVKFGDHQSPGQVDNGGVLVLESGRGFGGDSGFAYVGTYEVSGDKFKGTFSITQFDPDMESVWGPGITEANLEAELTREDDMMHGFMKVVGANLPPLPLYLVRFKDLP